ncbi:polyamine aminopropyltransferase [Parasulfitobacter algicola]|uniref:Polyamine aminopropyltransferase n=1 Tax=Parasulfitobacter algicola TaxID=2614809 RepID=A0ABX2IW01_9RHOB|nr:polyamine aminopropyltransferase [Sulfitobacter algicola]NSX56186.1 polyamine aminopropyltransferase [Sulfitobacter algicola]
MTDITSSDETYENLPAKQATILLMSITVVAMCGIVYELIIGTVSSYLLGNSVYQFSLTIGFFMFAMGIGSHLSRYIRGRLIEAFIYVEVALALLGGLSSITLFMMFPFAPWMYQVAMFSLIFSIGTLVGLEIPLLTRVLSARKGTRSSIADVMSLDYIGALFGSVAFPLLLLPSLGLITASFAIGLINIAVALLNVIWLREYLRSPKLTLYIVLGMFGLLVLLTAMATRITAYAQQHLYFDQIVWQKQTQYQSLVITNTWKRNDFRLFIDGHLQFSEFDEHRYHEALVHPVLSWTGPSKNVLVLGGGDGLAVREILKHEDVERIDLVDIDPEMTRLGRDFAPLVQMNGGSLSSDKVHLYNQDAFVFIQQTDRVYDKVIIDFPDPHNEAIAKLYSVEFYTMLSRRMSDRSLLVSQSTSPYFARNTYWTIAETMEAVFPKTTHYTISIPSFGVWGFNIAHKSQGETLGPMPEGLQFMSDQVFAASTVFPVDIARPDNLKVNSIFEPDLYQVYLADLK